MNRNIGMELVEPNGSAAAASVEKVETDDQLKKIARSEDSERDSEPQSTNGAAAAASEKVKQTPNSIWRYSAEVPTNELVGAYIEKVKEYIDQGIQGNEVECMTSLELLSELEVCLTAVMRSPKKMEIGAASGMDSVLAKQEVKEMPIVASTSQEDGNGASPISSDSETKKHVGNHVSYIKTEAASSIGASFIFDHSAQYQNGKVRKSELKKKAKPRHSFLNFFKKCCWSEIEDENEDDEDLQ